MATKEKYGKEETVLFHDINQLIDEKVHTSIQNQLKTGHHHHKKIDEAAVREKCADSVFHDLEHSMDAVYEDCEKFYELLKTDDKHLFEHLMKETAWVDKEIDKVKTFHDFVEMGKHHKIKHNTLEEVYTLGMRYYNAHNFHKAYLYMNWLSVADAKNTQVWFLKGVCEQNLKKYPEALATYDHVISLEPDFFHAYPQIMNCLILMGDLKNAKHVYEIFTHGVDKKSYHEDKYIVDNLECIKNCLR